jgi:hypothetical protein
MSINDESHLFYAGLKNIDCKPNVSKRDILCLVGKGFQSVSLADDLINLVVK